MTDVVVAFYHKDLVKLSSLTSTAVFFCPSEIILYYICTILKDDVMLCVHVYKKLLISQVWQKHKFCKNVALTPVALMLE